METLNERGNHVTRHHGNAADKRLRWGRVQSPTLRDVTLERTKEVYSRHSDDNSLKKRLFTSWRESYLKRCPTNTSEVMSARMDAREAGTRLKSVSNPMTANCCSHWSSLAS